MVAGMARANRLRVDGGVFHLTHRCHNRAFLLKFARDRDAYRAKAREHLQQFDVSVLDYCVTSNHVHLLVDASERLEVSGFMREVASELPGLTTRQEQGSGQRVLGRQLPRDVSGGWGISVAVSVLHRVEHGEVRCGGASARLGMGRLSRCGSRESLQESPGGGGRVLSLEILLARAPGVSLAAGPSAQSCPDLFLGVLAECQTGSAVAAKGPDD